MNFRAAARVLADLSSDMSADPSQGLGTDVDTPASKRTVQPDPQTDGLDPAAPGGPSPMNGAEPFGAAVATDPELMTPVRRRGPVPYLPGPNEDTTTIHDATLHGIRRASYYANNMRKR